METVADTNADTKAELSIENVEDFMNEEAFFDEDSSGDEMPEENMEVRGDRALQRYMEVMTTGLLPTKNAYYPLSKEAYLLTTEEQFTNIGLTFIRYSVRRKISYRSDFSISLDMWIDLRSRLRKIDERVEKRFRTPITETDYRYDLMHLFDGNILQVRFLGKDVRVHFCDEKLLSRFYLTIDEWRKFVKNSFAINLLVMDKWFNFVDKKAMY